jgi:hypothetical protein
VVDGLAGTSGGSCSGSNDSLEGRKGSTPFFFGLSELSADPSSGTGSRCGTGEATGDDGSCTAWLATGRVSLTHGDEAARRELGSVEFAGTPGPPAGGNCPIAGVPLTGVLLIVVVVTGRTIFMAGMVTVTVGIGPVGVAAPLVELPRAVEALTSWTFEGPSADGPVSGKVSARIVTTVLGR